MILSGEEDTVKVVSDLLLQNRFSGEALFLNGIFSRHTLFSR